MNPLQPVLVIGGTSGTGLLIARPGGSDTGVRHHRGDLDASVG